MAGGIQVASLYASIGADTGGLQTGLSGAKSSLTSFGKDFAKEAVSIASTAAIAIGAIKGIADITIDAANDWADYNLEMDKGATATGMMADEYSRLIQAADDAFVSQENMTKAMEMATKNGYALSIDSLGQIADKLNAIKDPAEKAEEATKIFGRGWADILPFLKQGSEGIDQATSAIKDNLVATEDSIRKSKDYKIAVDNLSDAWQGFRNEVGSKVMPILTAGMTAVSDQIAKAETLTTTIGLLKTGVDAGIISEEEYTNATLAANWSVEAGLVATQNLYNAHKQEFDQLNKGIALTDDYINRQNLLKESKAATSASISELTEAEIEAAAAQAELTQQFSEQYDSATSLSSNFSNIIGLAKSYTTSLQEINAQQEIMAKSSSWSKAYKDAEKAVADLQKSMAEAANQMTLDMFQATIAIGGVTKAELGAYMDMAVGMGAISQEGADAAIGAYNSAIDTINGYQLEEKTGNVVVDAAAAFAAFDLVEAYAFSDKVVRVMMKLSGDSGIGMQSAGPWDQRAAGGPVIGNTPYIVGEQGPELFVPESSGAIIPNGQMANAQNSDNSDLLAAINGLPKQLARAVRDAVLLVAG